MISLIFVDISLQKKRRSSKRQEAPQE